MKIFPKTVTTAIIIGVIFAADVLAAKLQVIHNSADPAAAVVDVYVNDNLLLNDFSFRTATPFLDVPNNVQLRIGVAPGNSNSPADVLAWFPVVFRPNKTYVAIANGVLDPPSFSANPDGKNTAFNIFISDNVRRQSHNRHRVDLMIYHGATDAPTIDVLADNLTWSRLVNNLSYGEFSGYRSLRPASYTLEITPGNDNHVVVAQFNADLSGLAGQSAIVFASGFLTPGDDQNGPAFGLFAALSNGTVVQLPAVAQQARLQVIHNCADPAASMVDIYVNGALFIDNFAFRTATPFIDVLAGVELNIGVAPANSNSADDVRVNFPVTFVDDKTYVVVANGVLDPSQFTSNPDGINVEFNLFAIDNGRESANWRYLVDVVAYHGATDAPEVDIRVRGLRRLPLFSNLQYGEFSHYRSLLPLNYILEITPSGDPNTVVAAFEANLRSLAGGAAVVFASGFLSPQNNQNGPAFGLFAALPNGNVVSLPSVNPLLLAKSEMESLLPSEFRLEQNYPNPFNPSTQIAFSLPEESQVKLTVYNLLGQEVARLIDGFMPAGNHEIKFDGSQLPSGVYLYRLQAGEFLQTQKMTLMK